MRNLITAFLLLLVFAPSLLLSQVIEEKVTRYNGPVNGDDIPRRITSDAAGNMYVTGTSEGDHTDFDFETIKYDNNGDIVWERRYNGTGNGYDEAFGIAVDAFGNVFVTGWSQGAGSGEDCVTIKYNSSGVEQWVRRFNGAANENDRGMAVGVDDAGNSYVGGWASNVPGSTDYLTIKYDPAGNLLWSVIQDGPDNGNDYIHRVCVTASGDVFVAGHMHLDATGQDLATIKYNTNGVEQWRGYYTRPGAYMDRPYSITTDLDGNILVAGESFSATDESEYITIKYAPDGTQLWANIYDGPGAGIDYINIVCTDKDGNVAVAGSSWGGSTDFDYCVIKYSPTGQELWVRRYDGPAHMFDCINGMAIDNAGNICYTGRSFGGYGLSFNDFYTMKYSPSGDLIWAVRYDSGPDSYDYGANLAVDQFGNVFVAGWSDGAGNKHDFVLIKYVDKITNLSTNGSAPSTFALKQNYPNPFNPSTKIRFNLPQSSDVNLRVYNNLGELMTELYNGNLSSGEYEYTWVSENFPSGVYYYKLEADGFTETRKMILMK